MKNILFLLFLSFPAYLASQVITEEQLLLMLESAQENCVGAHESVVLTTNEAFAKSVWGQKVRLNEAKIMKFFNYPSGEKVSANFDVYLNNKGAGAYSYDQKTAADLLTANGVRVTQSYDKLWINAKQDILYAGNIKEGHKIALEIYCPYQKFLEALRIGKIQSIEFLITGVSGSVSTDNKIYGVLTQVNVDKLTVKCPNGHEFDRDAGYKFCPTCGEPLK
ncbi:MAG: zinc ribbon domain-containing protein [Bacteroidota bacterium]